MEWPIQIQKLCHIENRKWLFVVGLVALTHLLCQSLLLPYGNAIMSLLPGQELPLSNKVNLLSQSSSVKSAFVSNSVLYNASASVDTTPLLGSMKKAANHDTGKGIDHRSGQMEEKRNVEDISSLDEKDLENNKLVEDGNGDDDFSLEDLVDLDENSPVQDYNSFLEKVKESRQSLSEEWIAEQSNYTSSVNDLGVNKNMMQEKTGITKTAVSSSSVALTLREGNPERTTDDNADDRVPSKNSEDMDKNSALQDNQGLKSVIEKGSPNESSLSLKQTAEPRNQISAENIPEADTNTKPEKRLPLVDSSVNLISSANFVSNKSIASSSLNRSSGEAEIKILSKDKNTLKKKMRSDMPPKTIMSIYEMNQLLLRHRRSSRAMRPQWSSVRDQEIIAAKLQIQNAPIGKNDGELYAPLFRNVSWFKRSYELMERTLKVYVYKDGGKPIFHQPILKGLYASEGWFMKLMEGNKHFVVKDSRKAHLFYMPFSSRMLEYTLYVRNSHNRTNLRQYLKQYSEKIAAKYRFWNRTGGADHFLVACHDWAPYETRHHMEHCIKALCNADVTAGFKIGRDVSLPETYVRSARNPLKDLGGKPPSRRHILAFYAGNMHGYLRPILLKHWKEKGPEMKIFGPMPPGVASKMNYMEHMKSSKYCICPKGYEVNSPRVVEAIFYECVPVIISDNFVPPFFEVLDWGAFSVILAEKDIPNLKVILLSIPHKKYLDLQLAVRMVQKHFLWHAKPLKYDLFHMTLHSIWYNRVFQIKPR
ncbi:Xylogalacturonan beta-1,3-xylosyltransferase [Bertholletia excelsa]